MRAGTIPPLIAARVLSLWPSDKGEEKEKSRLQKSQGIGAFFRESHAKRSQEYIQNAKE
jgi:hypothetical protein